MGMRDQEPTEGLQALQVVLEGRLALPQPMISGPLCEVPAINVKESQELMD